MKQYVTMGVVLVAGAALFEVAVIPGMVLGGAAILAPKYMPGLRRRLRAWPFQASVGKIAPLKRIEAILRPAPAQIPPGPLPASQAPSGFAIKQAIAKTITFRVLVTTLDFTTNYIVIGEFATAAGLSAFALVVGPVFYLAHEASWNRFGPPGPDVSLSIGRTLEGGTGARKGFVISRALAKTITFRTIATTMDFTTNFVVTRDLATTVTLSATGFILGPFVYLGHEMIWDRYAPPNPKSPALPASALEGLA